MIASHFRTGLVLALAALPAALGAQNPGVAPASERAAPAPAAPLASAVRRDGAIAIDGRLDEAAWQRATPITDFRQFEPDEGAPPSQPTEVRVLFDDEALYVGARMTQPGGVAAPLARRDQLLDSNGNNGAFNSLTTDKLIVDLDPYHNHLDDIVFEVNPAGVKGDQHDGDPSWDPIWDAAARVDSLGWTAEMRIPYSQLRFSRDSVQTWGMQVWRYLDRRNEHDMWSFWRRNASGGPAFFGQLTGLQIAHRPRQMELLPYAVTGSTFKYAQPADPYHGRSDTRFSAGTDVKYLLTSNLTLDATLNPDFGQVEVDPAVLNLSAFETYYDEKRPFFIAGASAFDFGGMRCMFCSNTSSLDAFYSRRIGRPPQLNGYIDDNSDHADAPDNTKILGAAKITGRTQTGYGVGLLDAVTSRERARFLPSGGGPEVSQVVEPLSNYFVGRVKKEFGKGETTFGGILTSVARQMGDTVVSNRLRSHAEAAGLDWRHYWHRHDYSWMGSLLFSNVAGSPEAIALTQQSSTHYFQRPDRQVTGDGLFSAAYDTTATSLRGYGLFTRVAKDNGSWLWEAMANIRSPGFEVNDLAFLSQTDFKWVNGNIARSWTKPTRWYRDMFASLGGATQYDYDGDRTFSQLQAFYSASLLNYWRIRLIGIHRPDSFDGQLTRGGPVVVRSGYDVESVQLSTDARARTVLDFTIEEAHGLDHKTHYISFRPGMALKPAPNVFIQLSPGYTRDETPAQYVTTVADPTAVAFNGTRYVFAFIRTKTMSLDTRLNWTFTPDLTLQLYAQPFVANGRYWSFREFTAPRTLRYLVYGQGGGTIAYQSASNTYRVDPDGAGPASPFTFDNPDFTNRALRGTAVLRWEYRPGSTLYFVWTQERSGSDPAAHMNLAMARDAVLRDRPINVFQIKATYWLGR